MKINEMYLVLEALQNAYDIGCEQIDDSILTAMHTAIAEAKKQEPVAWMRKDKGHIDFHRHPQYLPLYTNLPEAPAQAPVSRVVLRDGMPALLLDRDIRSTDQRLYAAPQPQREWVGLRPDEIEVAYKAASKDINYCAPSHSDFARIIEKILKEKNT
jgi:hypothetical protein